MNQDTLPLAPARFMRVLHAALVAGCVMLGVVFVFMVGAQGRSRDDVATLATACSAIGVVLLAVAALVLRRRVPTRSAQDSPDLFWSNAQTRTFALVLWAVTEGASLIGWVGYYLTGSTAPAVVAVLAIVMLVWRRPGSLERA